METRDDRRQRCKEIGATMDRLGEVTPDLLDRMHRMAHWSERYGLSDKMQSWYIPRREETGEERMGRLWRDHVGGQAPDVRG